MSKIMSKEEFMNFQGLEFKDFNELCEELYKYGITDMQDKLNYAKAHKYGQLYMYYVLQQLNDVFYCNCFADDVKFTFSGEAICGLLCSYMYSVEYMHQGLPQQVYEYIGEKSKAFVKQLIDQYEEYGAV